MSHSFKVSILKRGNRRGWYMQYRDPVSGKKHQRATNTNKRGDAIKIAGQWEAELNSGSYHEASKMTWEQFIKTYEDEAYPHLSKSAQSTRDVVFNHLERLYSPKSLALIATARMMSDFQSRLRKGKKSESTIHAYLSHFKSVLNWAVKQDIIKSCPVITLPKIADDELMRGRAITDAEFATMINSVELVRKYDVKQWRMFLRGLWLSGLRLNEALTLSWDKSEPFRIDANGLFPQFRIPSASQKSRKGQLVPIAPDFWQWLTEQTPIEQRNGYVLKLVALGRNRMPSGKQLSEKTACRTISDIGRKAKIVTNEDRQEFASAHDLRRSFGMRWRKRVKSYELQKLMRHAKIETTLKYYASESADDLSARIWQETNALGDQMGDQAGNHADSEENENA